METRLGKIREVKFGFGGYQECEVGLTAVLSMQGSEVVGFISGGYAQAPSKTASWTVEDQRRKFAMLTKEIIELLQKAKVDDVAKLKGIPVEVTLDGNLLKSWRILDEVL